MIPALGTCVFVACLYYKLKKEDEATNPPGVAAAADVGENAALTARLAALETRLQQLAREQEKPS